MTYRGTMCVREAFSAINYNSFGFEFNVNESINIKGGFLNRNTHKNKALSLQKCCGQRLTGT